MAPPKADLNNKEKVPEDETVPQAVVIDQSCAARRNVQQCKKRRCRIGLICLGVGILAIVIALPILVLHMKHHRRHFKSWCGTKDYKVPENVLIDDEKKLIFVNNTKTGEYDAFNALHDYANRMSAFRHAQSKRCFMEPLKTTFHEGIRQWDREGDDYDKPEHHDHDDHRKHDKHDRDDHHHEKPTRYYQALKPTDPSTANHFWGENVANHCMNHKFHMLQPITGEPPKPDSTTLIIKIASKDAIRVIFIRVDM